MSSTQKLSLHPPVRLAPPRALQPPSWVLLVAASAFLTPPGQAADSAIPPPTLEVPFAAPPVAEPFPLTAVRLLDGPLKQALELERRYMLDVLEPDRLLSWFRKEAGLERKGVVYGGWESMGVAGQTLGHYLSGIALLYQATGDRRALERLNYIIGELEECQKAHGDGYLCAFPNGRKAFDDLRERRRRSDLADDPGCEHARGRARQVPGGKGAAPCRLKGGRSRLTNGKQVP